jgi:hypothetical protein
LDGLLPATLLPSHHLGAEGLSTQTLPDAGSVLIPHMLRHVPAPSLTLALLCLAACGSDDAASAKGEDDIRATLDGRFETDAPSNGRFWPGFLYGIEIYQGRDKRPDADGWSVVLVVSDKCGKDAPDHGCDRAFLDRDPDSLDRYGSDLRVATAQKTFSVAYEKPSNEGDPIEVKRSWTYQATPDGGLSLREQRPGGGAAFTLKRLPPHKVDAAVKAAFQSYADDDGSFDDGPVVRNKNLPIAAQREVHYYDQEWSDYGTTTKRLTIGGNDYYALSQMNDGGGKYIFFTLDGDGLGEFGGSESGEWDFEWYEH